MASKNVKLCKLMAKREERLGWREEKGRPWRIVFLNYRFSEMEILVVRLLVNLATTKTYQSKGV